MNIKRKIKGLIDKVLINIDYLIKKTTTKDKYKKLDFIVIGVQKGGTTSMIYHMNQHPNIFMAEEEIHFFNKKNFVPYYVDYHKNFPQDKITGEKTPSYCYLRFAMDRIHKYNPNIKLVLILRDPIKRAFSEWNMFVTNKLFNKEFIDSIKETENVELADIKENGYWALQRGYYIDHIEYILTKFDRKNLYIGISENFKKNPLEEYNKIFEFLGQEKLDEIQFDETIHVLKYDRQITNEEKNYLKQKYSDKTRKLFDFLGYTIKEWDV